ncbi:hypothetical protein CAF53_03005 [Sphingobium sp. LB126]|nr:hypothetical protein CAF53_03005 [Sphingobium sp. LB126]
MAAGDANGPPPLPLFSTRGAPMKPMLALLPVLAVAVPFASMAQTSAEIVSLGRGNGILVDQSAANAAAVDVQQIGDGNALAVTQVGSGQSARLTIHGSANDIRLNQGGSGANGVELSLTGDGHLGRLDQFADAGGSNMMLLDQSGAANFATLSQTAYVGMNEMSLRQHGQDNSATMTQNGDDNRLALTQNGDGNAAALSQTGNGLGLALTQTGGAAITITQTAH